MARKTKEEDTPPTAKAKTKATKSIPPASSSATKKTLLEQVEEEMAAMANVAKTRRRVKPIQDGDHEPTAKPKVAPEKAKSTQVQTKRVRSKTPAKPAPLSADAIPEPPVDSVPALQAPKKSARAKSKPATQATDRSIDHDDTLTSLPVPVWRKREAAPKDSKPNASNQNAPESQRAPMRSKSKQTREPKERDEKPKRDMRQERQKPTEPDPKAVTVAPKRRERIVPPAHAARVVSRDGVPTLVKGTEVLPPIVFFASAMDEKALEVVLDEYKLASNHGVRLFSFLVELEVDVDRIDDSVAFAAYMVKQTKSVTKDPLIILRTVFVSPPGWESKYKRAKYLCEDGSLAEPSLCDDEYWETAKECLDTFIKKIQRLDSDNSVIGIHLERGEWFLADGSGFDTSEAARGKFQEWLRHRYLNDKVSLRASWFDGNADFDSVNIPEYREVRSSAKEFVRTDRRARRWVDCHLFLSDSTCERISDLAYTAKLASSGSWIVGTSYGYTFEWSHPASGHLSLGKLLRSPDLDYVGGPPSYKDREPGGTCAFPTPIDSIALNGKLFISEEDFKTPINAGREPDDFNPLMKTPQALGSVHWRGAGSALAHSSGVCWMDTWGNGWLDSIGIWERAQNIKQCLTWRLAAPTKDPDTAVFIDERSLAYLVDKRAFEALVQNVREALLRAGLNVGFYLLSDLAHRERFPEAKFHIFVNAWDIRPEVRSAIKTRLQRDGKVLFWLYCAGLFEGGRDSLERVREVTGIALRPQPFNSRPGTTLLNSRDPLCQYLSEQAISKGGQLEPSYFAIPEDGQVLGEYSHTGLPSFIERTFASEVSGKWHSVFLGEPIVSPGLFRSLAQLAGAHVWNFQNDVVHVSQPFLTVHCTGTGPRTMALPEKFVAYAVESKEWISTDGGGLRFQGLDGSTHTFLVGTRTEVESLIDADPEKTMRMEALPPEQENTLHWEDMRFDVPIMKLDEWVEESWTEDMADDLLIKPSMLEIVEETSEPETMQRSRGRRRNRRNMVDRKAPTAPDDGSVNVMFRKRE